MSWWKKLFGTSSDDDGVDYYREGLELLRVSKYHEALTSFRLALKSTPGDTAVMQQIAITYTRIGMTDEAIKTYRGVLSRDARSAGAHYGLAFLLLAEGQRDEAARHLEAFLADPPETEEAGRHVEHARSTLAELSGAARADGDYADAAGPPPAAPPEA